MEWLSWQRWLEAQQLQHLEPCAGCTSTMRTRSPRRRWPDKVWPGAHALVADSLAQENLVEVLPGTRLDSPTAYWLLVGTQSAPT